MITFDSALPKLIPAPKPLRPVIARIAALDKLHRLYNDIRGSAEKPIPAALLDRLSVSYRIASSDLAHIPASGPCIVVANHPFGILDGALLAVLLGEIRTDVRFLANGVMASLPELSDVVIPVDLDGITTGNSSGIRQAIRHVQAGGLLVVFPAGEVSHFDWKKRAVVDGEWHPIVARVGRLLAKQGVPVRIVPMHIEGSNSPWFQAAGIVHPRLRTALLGRELLNKAKREVRISAGSAITAAKLLDFNDIAAASQYLRWRTDILAHRQEFKARTSKSLARLSEPSRQAIAPPVAADVMTLEIGKLRDDQLLASAGDLRVYIASAQQIPNILGEIGRLREATFRAAGEGTGQSSDIDRFDAHYQHLFLWDAKARQVAGAYRLAKADTVVSTLGRRGLYTASLFHYGDSFLRRLGPSIELGRSFIRVEYQRGFSPLLLLWKGIGKYVANNPEHKVLFGPVSISNDYHSVSREMMVAFLEQNASLTEWMKLIVPLNPFRPRGNGRSLPPGLDLDDVSAAVADLEPGRAGVPVLLRQYLKLGGKLLGFNVDPNFSDALDGLIVVDLTRTEPKLLERYLGKAEAAQILEFQKGAYAA